MDAPGNDNTPPQGKRPAGAALFVLSALIVILLVIGADKKQSVKNATETETQSESGLPAPLPGAVPEAPADSVDDAITRAWQDAARRQQIDPSQYDAVYLQDAQSVTVILTPRENAPIPAYEITVERGSNRVTGLTPAAQ